MKIFGAFLKLALTIVVLGILVKTTHAQSCSVKNYTFKSGEEIVYVISYDWFIIWTEVGEVRMTINETQYDGKPAYEYTGYGQTFRNWDIFFKVRDKFETIVDQNTLKPFQSSREIREGNYRQNDKYTFDHDNGVVFTENKTNDKPQTFDTLSMKSCTFDIMSALIFARNIDFSKFRKGDTIPITVLLDKEMYPIYFRYLGIENYKVKHVGTFECIKFSVLLVEGEMFHEGEDMTIWATNDQNHIVVYAESPILVGSIRVQIADVKNNRYPFTSLKK